LLSNLINRECVLYLAGSEASTDEYGNATDSFTPVETVCELQQQRRDEPGTEGEYSDTRWMAFFLPGESMGSKPTANVLTVEGDAYEFVGDPWLARDPGTKQASHWEVSLRRTATEVGS
jgi:hypothetical protein